MEIQLIPVYTDRKLFLDMARDYVDTLHEYDSSIRWDELTWQDNVWSAYFIMEDRTIQGFVVKEEIPYKVFPDMLYIMEFYVVPESRGRGVGTAAVEALVKDWHEDVFVYILKDNFTAKAFWSAVENKLGWERIQRPEIRNEKGCELRVYHAS